MIAQRFELDAFQARHALTDDQFAAMVALVKPAVGGPWIVGGSVRCLVAQMPQDSDCDVAFAS